VNLKTRVMLNTFTTSLAATMLQRGAYFFTHDIRGFSQAQNLWLALLVGIAYIGGAYNSQRITVRFGERRTLVTLLGALAVLHVLLACISSSAFLVGALAVVACLQGAMWPIFESYISAGETPADLGRVLSRYNISWALSTAPALFLAGLLITSGFPWLLFVVAAALFALHPVAVESVAWVSEQKNTLSTLFYLASALAYLRFADRRRAADYALGLALFVLALLAAEPTRGGRGRTGHTSS